MTQSVYSKLPMYAVLRLGLFILGCSQYVFAQEQLGIRLDNYAGVNALVLNPAASLSYPLTWSVNLGEASFFAKTDYGFIRDANTSSFLRASQEVDGFRLPDELTTDENTNPDALILDFKSTTEKRFAQAQARILGPSFMVNLGDQWSVGLQTGYRIMGGSLTIPGNIVYRSFYLERLDTPIEVAPFQLSLGAWQEYALSGAYKTETMNGRMAFGASLRFIRPEEGGYLVNANSLNAQKQSNTIIRFDELKGQFAFTHPDVENNTYQRSVKGSGFSVDLGFQYLVDGEGDVYRFKFGAALLDVGALTFKETAEAHAIDVRWDSLLLFDSEDYKDFNEVTEIDAAVAQFEQNLTGRTGFSLKQNQFTMWMPTALMLQGELALNPRFFVSALLVQGISLQEESLKRGSMMAVVPRIEHRWYAVAMPLSFYQYTTARIGASVRLGWLTVGTEDLLSHLTKSNFTGTDFYVALQVTPFSLGNLSFGGRKKSKWGGRGKVKCYKF